MVCCLALTANYWQRTSSCVHQGSKETVCLRRALKFTILQPKHFFLNYFFPLPTSLRLAGFSFSSSSSSFSSSSSASISAYVESNVLAGRSRRPRKERPPPGDTEDSFVIATSTDTQTHTRVVVVVVVGRGGRWEEGGECFCISIPSPLGKLFVYSAAQQCLRSLIVLSHSTLLALFQLLNSK